MFKLLIECSKDIDKINIDFSDGTSVMQESEPKPERTKKRKNDISENRDEVFNEGLPKYTNEEIGRPHRGGFLDTDAEFGGISQDVVKLPEINREDRPVKVAEELQNFDF